MVFGLGCQRERLYKPLYVAHLFILAGVVYYYFQGSVGKPAPDHEIAGEPSQLVGETLRPVWGPTDKCYPVTTQRRRAKGGKKQASEENTKVRKEIAVYASEASEGDNKEERPGGWVPQLLRKLWLDWFPAPEIPKTQNHE
ncbi:uncharacterized protein LOC123780677 isoform X7 [Ursus americanus]|uniref:Uncharacterized protein LOC103674067 isoform X4 n=1 Tax=Ursus maritimus TaxID=29073 RepID=A0A8M1GD28_URSMA|nr:uncharacterized protein LOC103674067 isoform X4 [Ursus maritimus]XP_045635656.1 uncharacterized protein LOC123780677 isoform X7 [Ursus americanus]